MKTGGETLGSSAASSAADGGWQQRLAAVGFAILVAGMAGVLAVAVWHLPTVSPGLSEHVAGDLHRAEATNPVTAVLLNFRSYDTLLELAVLLLAVMGAQILTRSEPSPSSAASLASTEAGFAVDAGRAYETSGNPVLRGFVRMLAPVMILVAGYVLWVGGHAPGGAFQAGAVLAALGVLMLLAASRQQRAAWARAGRTGAWLERLLLVAGLAVFVAVGIGVMFGPRRFLEYPTAQAKWLILLIEALATISIAAILIALFRGGRLFEDVSGGDGISERGARGGGGPG